MSILDDPIDSRIAQCIKTLPIDSEISAAELGCLSERAVAKRRNQFILGRIAARTAMAKLGLIPTPPVLVGANREPLWPPSVVGSITHCDEIAVAAVGFANQWDGIGIDLEALDRNSKFDIAGQIAQASELAWIRAGSDESEQHLRTMLIFSAKESFYKALFPSTGMIAGFQDVMLEPGDNSFQVTLIKDWSAKYLKGMSFRVEYRHDHELVFTYTALLRTGESTGPNKIT